MTEIFELLEDLYFHVVPHLQDMDSTIAAEYQAIYERVSKLSKEDTQILNNLFSKISFKLNIEYTTNVDALLTTAIGICRGDIETDLIEEALNKIENLDNIEETDEFITNYVQLHSPKKTIFMLRNRLAELGIELDKDEMRILGLVYDE